MKREKIIKFVEDNKIKFIVKDCLVELEFYNSEEYCIQLSYLETNDALEWYLKIKQDNDVLHSDWSEVYGLEDETDEELIDAYEDEIIRALEILTNNKIKIVNNSLLIHTSEGWCSLDEAIYPSNKSS